MNATRGYGIRCLKEKIKQCAKEGRTAAPFPLPSVYTAKGGQQHKKKKIRLQRGGTWEQP
jgi:hypothetical protein